MTSILTSQAWSEPITVAAGDILQNSGTRSILVCAQATADADDSLLIRPRGWYICTAEMTIRVSTHGVGIGRITIARGLGENDGVTPLPRVTLTATPSTTVAEDDPIGTVVATLTTDATDATLGGTDAALLEIDGADVVTTAALTGKTGLSFTITGTRADYQPRTVNVSVSVAEAEVPEETDLSVANVQGERHVSGTGDITWTITEPAEYAGTHTHDQSEEYAGLLNIGYTENTAPQCIVAPDITRYSGPGTASNHYPGTEYEFTPPLWPVKAGAAVSQGHEWYEDGVATGFTGLRFSRAGSGSVKVVSWIDVDGQPRRSVKSVGIAGETYSSKDEFTAPDGTGITAYSGPSGYIWSVSGGSNWKIYAGYIRGQWGIAGRYFATRSDPVAANQWAEIEKKFPAPFEALSDLTTAADAVAVRVNPLHLTATDQNVRQGYIGELEKSGSGLIYRIQRINHGSTGTSNAVILAQSAVLPISNFPAGSLLKLRLEVTGSTTPSLTLKADGETVLTTTDTNPNPYTSGLAGVMTWGAGVATSTADQGPTSFDAGSL